VGRAHRHDILAEVSELALEIAASTRQARSDRRALSALI
jgi:hypothetical protein